MKVGPSTTWLSLHFSSVSPRYGMTAMGKATKMSEGWSQPSRARRPVGEPPEASGDDKAEGLVGSGTGSESGESGESGVGCLGLFKESETLGWGCGYGACVERMLKGQVEPRCILPSFTHALLKEFPWNSPGLCSGLIGPCVYI